jgi:hypothetical protein
MSHARRNKCNAHQLYIKRCCEKAGGTGVCATGPSLQNRFAKHGTRLRCERSQAKAFLNQGAMPHVSNDQ